MHLWVMIRCIEHGIDRLSRGDWAPADLHRLGCDPSALHDGRVIAQHFLDGATNQVRISEQFAEFTGMLQQRQYGVTDRSVVVTLPAKSKLWQMFVISASSS